MKLFFRNFAFCVCAAGLSLTSASAVQPFVHQLFTNNMVLQRDAADPIWGWTMPGAAVSVTVNGHVYNATANATTGRWQATVGPFPAGGPYTVSIAGPQSVTLSNVLFGDVWLCAGQSNMAYTINSMGGAPVLNAAAEINDSVNYPNLRVFTTSALASATSLEILRGGSWTVPGTATTGDFTATGYFFGRELYRRLGNTVPIGIVCSAVGGTDIKSWLDPQYTSTAPDLAGEKSLSVYYNGMICPLAPFAFKGVCFYQGEANYYAPVQYSRLLTALRTDWRLLFGAPSLPFVFIQICTWGGGSYEMSALWPNIREVQAKVAAVAGSNSAAVSILDLGDGNIHPKDKQDVGYRAARAAAALANGQNVVSQGPVFDHAVIQGGSIRCYFTNVAGGLMVGTKSVTNPLTAVQPSSGSLGVFHVAGANGVFYQATAAIDSSTNSVLVSSASVSAPVYVRYGWTTYNAPNNLYNKIVDAGGNVIDGMPASSFHTDPVYEVKIDSDYRDFSSPTAILSAGTPAAGQIFDHWSGDAGVLANPLSSTTTATLTQSSTYLTAIYRTYSGPLIFPPWISQDISNVAVSSGSAFMDIPNEAFSLASYGANIGGTADSFRFAFLPFSGDGTITARVIAQQLVSATPSQAGVMMRTSLAPDSPYAFAAVRQIDSYYQVRLTAGANPVTSGNGGIGKWVRLTRTGNQFKAYRSQDGLQWTLTGAAITINTTGPIYAGLAVSSGLSNTLSSATFDNVSSFPGFSDTFDDGVADGWTTYGGTWAVGSGIYNGTSSGAKALIDNLTVGDFTCDADVSIGNGDAGVVFRVSNPGIGTDVYQGYYAGFTAGSVVLGRANNGWTPIASTAATVSINAMHHLRVTASGSSIKVYLDNMETPKITATDAVYSSGKIGVRLHSTATAKFDNITVIK